MVYLKKVITVNPVHQFLKVDEKNNHFVKIRSFYNHDKELESFNKFNKRIDFKNCFQFSEASEDDVKLAMNQVMSTAVGSDEINIDMIKAG